MKRQRGFSLVAAIFLLVVLALLGTFALRIGGVQQHTVDLALLGARALSAADSGLEWAAARALASTPECDAGSHFDLPNDGLTGFRVSVTCAATTHTEGAATITVYSLESFAEYGTYGQVDYVSRRVRARFTR